MQKNVPKRMSWNREAAEPDVLVIVGRPPVEHPTLGARLSIQATNPGYEGRGRGL